MAKDQLYPLRPGFVNAGPLYCSGSASIEGVLSFFPTLRTPIDVHYIEFPRPRAGLAFPLLFLFLHYPLPPSPNPKNQSAPRANDRMRPAVVVLTRARRPRRRVIFRIPGDLRTEVSEASLPKIQARRSRHIDPTLRRSGQTLDRSIASPRGLILLTSLRDRNRMLANRVVQDEQVQCSGGNRESKVARERLELECRTRCAAGRGLIQPCERAPRASR